MTRQRAPVEPPVVLTVAGSDSGGGAGIQADLKTIEAGGAFGTSVITSVTAQHTRGVRSTHLLPLEEIEAQYEAVAEDFAVEAVKTGMLATEEVIELVTEKLTELSVPAVVDPVMVAASGDRLLDEGAESAYEDLAREAALLTPNADEAEVLTGIEVESTEAAVRAGEQLIEDGVDAALVKGGHVDGEEVVDVFVTDERVERISHPRVETAATHGSGCTLSSAIATRLAYGDDLETAIRTGTDLLARAVRYSLDVGEGPGAVHHMVAARDRAEREPTAEAVRNVLETLMEADAGALVPEVGMNVAGATPYAEVPGECAAVEGRIGRAADGIAVRGDVRYGASDHVAQTLLAARESHPEYRFALDCRFGSDIEAALETLGWPVGAFDRANSPDGEPALAWGVRQAFAEETTPPVGVIDRGGREPLVTLLATDAPTLAERATSLLGAVEQD
ncbi:bifunctional hydroxymethylpyrimidine kinase/phosphomethylpyrimidine kinase [Halovenus sp. WSH3]|uniref:Bifunctional hydroxymethylpyrimidine kinase/phosphomethylpyrimidine kinase n=1 Tax=Halovenus carboxidivorans TaxID=2692199 RepID=A0A6B0SZA4_9EURY|nr:bifunctional hydroxymethylpyrimidine kinase/phosphomethylpyrimidine kinase [Halovenus carboxidivorans]MXR50815.1 bifunctional hydroxymethylpyrimidine kinase/phosphomethylpyrimidine kinase [Halovenus carboxidivorans]